MPSMPDFMRAIFGPFAYAAGRPELLLKLKTADLPKERKAEQIDKLKNLKVYGGPPLAMFGSRFVARFKDGQRTVLCIQVEGISETGLEALESQLSVYDAARLILDESTFLFMALHFEGYYKPKPTSLDIEAAKNVVDISDEDSYVGHDIGDIVNLFESVALFDVPNDSIVATSSEMWIAAFCAVSDPQFRTTLFSQAYAEQILKLLSSGNVNPENIYYALTSVHWKHAFLEIYKYLEAIYYLPWVLNLKGIVGVSDAGYDLSRKLRETLRWREKEKDSISSLFALVDEGEVRDISLNATSAFSGIDISLAKVETIAHRIYKIRNIMVHQEDYYDTAPITIKDTCWPVILNYMINIVGKLYSQHPTDANFSYLLDTNVPINTEAQAA